jgi:hypothetical protein
MGRECSAHEGDEKTYEILVGKPEGKTQFERHRRRWEDNIKLNLTEIVFGGRWIKLI